MSILIHATNVKGLGAVQVVASLLKPLLARCRDENVTLLTPEHEDFGTGDLSYRNLNLKQLKRRLPNSLSRLIECSPLGLLTHSADRVLVLGDIPLHGKHGQVVFVHQAHLISPRVNRFVGREGKFRLLRHLFAKNLRFVKTIIVQSEPFMRELQASYGLSNDRFQIIPQTAPQWFDSTDFSTRKDRRTGKAVFFYPASGYPHKNHAILSKMHNKIGDGPQQFEILLTLQRWELPSRLHNASWIKTIGQLSPDLCRERYQRVDGLFFPSLLESFGLPLIEAMYAGLQIVCSDLSYARWLCDGQAVYFDPLDGADAIGGLEESCSRIQEGKQARWKSPLAKFPKSWDEVAEDFFKSLG